MFVETPTFFLALFMRVGCWGPKSCIEPNYGLSTWQKPISMSHCSKQPSPFLEAACRESLLDTISTLMFQHTNISHLFFFQIKEKKDVKRSK